MRLFFLFVGAIDLALELHSKLHNHFFTKKNTIYRQFISELFPSNLLPAKYFYA